MTLFLRQLGRLVTQVEDPRLFSNTCRHLGMGASRRRQNSTVCQLNNHPDFRLKQARSKVGDAVGPDQSSAKGRDDTGHLALLETWMLVRREILEIRMHSTDNGDVKIQLELDLRFLLDRKKYLEEKLINLECDHFLQGQAKSKQPSVKEGGIVIQSLENPVRSNDGTSSGAKAEARLREARRKVLDSLKMN